MFDAHIHLNQYKDIDRQIEQWQQAGIEGVAAVSTDLRSSYETLSLKQRYPDFIFAAIGFHPEQPLPSSRDITEWENLLRRERHLISAIGEVGLPYYTLHEQQHDSLEHYIAFLDEMMCISKRESLPIILHAVHSHTPIAYDLLTRHHILTAHFHWLKAAPSVVKQITDSGYYISVTPEACYRERDQDLIRHVPLKQLLTETDGPWPFSGPFQNKATSPIFIEDVIKKIAEVKGKDIMAVQKQCKQNMLSLFEPSALNAAGSEENERTI